MSRLFPTFRRGVIQHGLWPEGATLIVGVSGGIDSIVMLDLIMRLATPMQLSIIVAHVNHALRGTSSDNDERFVREAAERYGLCAVSKRLPPSPTGNRQEEARRLRLAFFDELYSRHEAFGVCLGHQMHDQAETVLLHLLRGSGMAGLCGMRPTSTSGDMRVIRPLLGFSRTEIERYATQRKLAFRQDVSNASTRYRRNDIRLTLFPLLRTWNPRIEAHLASLAERLAQDHAALEAVSSAAFEESLISEDAVSLRMHRAALISMPKALRKRVLGLAFARLAGSKKGLAADHLERMDQLSQGEGGRASYRLPGRCHFERRGHAISIVRDAGT